MSSNSLIIKISHGTDMRRFTIDNFNTLNWDMLVKRVADAFGPFKSSFKLTYVDDEGDQITVSSDEELLEAVGLARKATPPVLRLAVLGKKDKKEAPDEQPAKDKTTKDTEAPTKTSVPAALPELAPFLEMLVQQMPAAMAAMPEALRTMLPHLELDVGATIAANAQAEAAKDSMEGAGGRCPWMAAQRAGGDPFCPPKPHGAQALPGVHVGVTCDVSGMCPIVGHRYHLVGHNYDLCQAEFEKLPEKKKALFRKIPPPEAPATAPVTAPAAAAPTTAAAPPVAPLPTPPNPFGQGFHPGVECDRSGMNPIVGMRFHLRGHNYDLCQAEYDKLSAAEKVQYEAIPPSVGGRVGMADAAQAAMGDGGCAWRPHGWRQRAAAWAAAHAGGGMPPAHGGMPPGLAGRCGMGWHGMPAARFVRDVTIFDGTQVSPGTPFTKIWRLKNVGEVPWPAGTKMLFVGGDQMTTEMSVPISRETPVQPGEEVDVAVELTAPSEHGRYLGYWRLTGPHGRRKFGQRVWCHIHVVDMSATMDSAAFENMQATLDEIERKKKALAATEADGDGDGADDGAHDGAHAGAQDGVHDCMYAAEKMMSPAPTPAAPGFPIEASKDGTISEDGSYVEVVASEVVAEAKADAASTAVVTDPGPSQPINVLDTKGALRAMGFNGASLIEAVIAKNGDDLDACVRDLAAAAEWDPLLDDLEEMGFGNRELNRTLMLKNSGNVKRTVKDLVEA